MNHTEIATTSIYSAWNSFQNPVFVTNFRGYIGRTLINDIST